MESLVQIKRKIKEGKDNNLPTGFLPIFKSPASAAARPPMQGSRSLCGSAERQRFLSCAISLEQTKFPIPEKQQQHAGKPA